MPVNRNSASWSNVSRVRSRLQTASTGCIGSGQQCSHQSDSRVSHSTYRPAVYGRVCHPASDNIRHTFGRKLNTYIFGQSLPRVRHRRIYLADTSTLSQTVTGRHLLISAAVRPHTCVILRTHNTFGDKSFAAVGPRVYDNLQSYLRQDVSYTDNSNGARLKIFPFGC